jgi:hypothetical protein
MRRRERTIAFFGSARLVKSHTGRVTLCGGTVNDRRAAREWCSHFLHEAVVEVHRPNLHLHNSPTNITLSASTGERAG